MSLFTLGFAFEEVGQKVKWQCGGNFISKDIKGGRDFSLKGGAGILIKKFEIHHHRLESTRIHSTTNSVSIACD